jgi:hypothetical protein
MLIEGTIDSCFANKKNQTPHSTAFLMFFTEKRAALVAANQGASTPELGRLAGAAWAQLDAAAKEAYLARFRELKAAHETAKAQLEASLLHPPKRASSAFLLYSMDHKAPAGVGLPAHARQLGAQWASLAPQEKQTYELRFVAEKARHEVALKGAGWCLRMGGEPCGSDWIKKITSSSNRVQRGAGARARRQAQGVEGRRAQHHRQEALPEEGGVCWCF